MTETTEELVALGMEATKIMEDWVYGEVPEHDMELLDSLAQGLVSGMALGIMKKMDVKEIVEGMAGGIRASLKAAYHLGKNDG